MNIFQAKSNKVPARRANQPGSRAAVCLLVVFLTACTRSALTPPPQSAATQPPPLVTPTVRPTRTPRAAASPAPERVAEALSVRSATVTELRGGVQARENQAASFRAAQLGEALGVGAGIRTDDTGQATLKLTEGSIIRVDRSTTFELTELSGDETNPQTVLGLNVGRLFVLTAQVLGLTGFDIQTPAGVASVRGSAFSVQFNAERQEIVVTCLESSTPCTFSSGDNTATLSNGQTLTLNEQGILRVQDVSYEALQEFLTLVPEAAGVLATAFPNGTPTLGPTRTPTPGATETPPAATDTAVPAAAPLVIIFPTATFTPAPTSTPLPTNTPGREPPDDTATFTPAPTSTPTRTPTPTCAPTTVPCP